MKTSRVASGFQLLKVPATQTVHALGTSSSKRTVHFSGLFWLGWSFVSRPFAGQADGAGWLGVVRLPVADTGLFCTFIVPRFAEDVRYAITPAGPNES